LLNRRLLRPHLRDGLDQVFFATQIFNSQRMGDIFFHENFPAPTLCAQREKFRVGTVHRYPELQRQFFLAIGCVERNKVRAIRIHDQGTDALH
jgi:hypothetical protein